MFKQKKECLNVIAAVDENMCIGKEGVLPWELPSEFQYFLSMTSKPKSGLQNAVIIGRKTWETMDQVTSKPFPNSVNIVLSSGDIPYARNYKHTVVAHSIKEAIEIVQSNPQIEEIWVLGGSLTYKLAITSPYFHRLYLTHIHAAYDCDSYFPFTRDELESGQNFRVIPQDEINDPRVPIGIQTDPKDGVQYEVRVYGKPS